MVTGIESFKEWFKGNESQYAIIGGTACDILMTEEGLDFRATKDIDLVLIIEAVDAERAGAEPEGLRQGLLHRLSRLYLRQPDGQAHPPQLSEPAFPGFSGRTPDEAYPLPRPAPQLRKPALRQRREPEGNSGVAGAQRYQHNKQHLYTSGFLQ